MIFKISKTISYQRAAKIIGTHFPEVSDKLTNFLQLQSLSTQCDSELIEASISQKTKELSPIPFVKAVDMSKNIKYIKWVAIPIVVIIFCLIFIPSFIKGST